jgi:hypothetical protein
LNNDDNTWAAANWCKVGSTSDKDTRLPVALVSADDNLPCHAWVERLCVDTVLGGATTHAGIGVVSTSEGLYYINVEFKDVRG